MQAVVLTTLAVLVVSLAGPSLGRSPPRAGGLSDVKPADPQIRLLVKSVEDEIVTQLPLGYDRETTLTLTPVSYKVQIVAGKNYFVKISTGFGRYIHARIYRDLRGNTSVSDVQLGKSLSDPIRYF
ncbi:cystatin-A1-like [Crassostrea virginica]